MSAIGSVTSLHPPPAASARRLGKPWTWDFAFDREAQLKRPTEVEWNRQIIVPFAPETPASGIQDTHFFRACWYRREFFAPQLDDGERLILHFGAVDHHATVWLNGQLVCKHEGGYTPFSCDITSELRPDIPQVLAVRAEDDPYDLTQPMGKQGWQLNPRSIWYHRTSGIWRTVWLERIPPLAIPKLRWTSSLERWEIGLDAHLDGIYSDGLRLRVRLEVGDLLLAEDAYRVVGMETQRRIALTDPGIDDYRHELLWSPVTPTIITALISLEDASGKLMDSVQSYTALAQSTCRAINSCKWSAHPLRLLLDQGYWPDSGATPPRPEGPAHRPSNDIGDLRLSVD